jgi:parallel beta-helix repeat protein
VRTTKLHNYLFIFAIIFLFPTAVFSQGVGINTSGNSPDPSAILDVSSTDRGFLTPRMTSLQRAAISSPAIGLMVYDTDDAKFYYFNGTVWVFVQDSGDSFWSKTGNYVYNVGDSIGIGTNSPTSKLTVDGDMTAGKINNVVFVDGVTYTTIQDAIDALPATGGKVMIPEGTYTLTTELTIPNNNITIEGTGDGTIIEASTNITLIDANNRTGINIHKVAFSYNSATHTLRRGVDFTRVRNSKVTECNFTNCYYGVYMPSINGEAKFNIVSNNSFVGCLNGIYISSSANLAGNTTINGNVIDGSGLFNSNGIYITGNRATNNSVSNNIISDTYDGISIMASAHKNSVTGNTIETLGRYGINVQSNSNMISGNNIIEATNISINCTASFNNINGNVITDAQNVAIFSSGGSNNMEGNTIYDCLNHGIETTATYGSITGNTIRDAGDATGEYAISVSGSYTTVSGNLINTPFAVGVYVESDVNTITGNTITGSGEHGIQLTATSNDNTVSANSLLSPGVNTLHHGIQLQGLRNTVNDNAIQSASGNGINSTNTDNTISNNSIYQPVRFGVAVTANDNAVLSNTIVLAKTYGIYTSGERTLVADNTIRNNTGTAIHFTSTAIHSEASSNVINNSADHGIDNDAEGVSMLGNKIYSIGNQSFEHGIINSGIRCIMNNNAIYDPSGNGIYNTADNATVNGNNIYDPILRGINFDDADYCTVNGNYIEAGSGFGIYLEDSEGNTVVGNMIKDAFSYAIALDNSDYNTINDNTIIDAGAIGIHLGLISNNNTISTNNIQNPGSMGIHVENCDDNSLVGNTINNPVSIGIWVEGSPRGSYNVISSNKLKNCQDLGIYTNSGSYNTITGNNLQGGSTNHGISVSSTFYCTITGNFVTGFNNTYNIVGCDYSNISANTANGGAGDGFYLSNVDNCTINSNMSYNNTGLEYNFVTSTWNMFDGNNDSNGGSTSTAGCTSCTITDNM